MIIERVWLIPTSLYHTNATGILDNTFTNTETKELLVDVESL